MTNQLARNILSELKVLMTKEKEPLLEEQEALDMAISALKQEPCEDAISREDVIKLVECSGYDLQFRTDNADMCDDVRKLPSVTPSRRKGHWIEERDDYGEIQGWHCSNCYEDSGFTTDCKWDSCPNCGADMRESEVSNDR